MSYSTYFSNQFPQPDEDGWQIAESNQQRRKRVWLSMRFFILPMQAILTLVPDKHIPPAPPRPDRTDIPILKQTRHEFRPPLTFLSEKAIPSSNRKRSAAVKAAVDRHNCSTFARFLQAVEVSALAMRSQYDRRHNARYNVFAMADATFLATVPIFLQSISQQPMVMIGGGSITLEDFLARHHKPFPVDVIGAKGYKLLHQWHVARSKFKRATLSFAAVAEDIQNVILLHMLGETRLLKYSRDNSLNGFTLCEGRRARDTDDYGPAEIDSVDLTTIRLLNRRINTTSLKILYHGTVKAFDNDSCLTGAITDFPLAHQILNRIQLCFTDLDYLDFFGADVPGVSAYQITNPGARLLKQLPSLRSLEFWFHSTYNTRHCNPWFRDPTDYHRRDREYYFPCRKGMIDVIMVSAWPHIKHIPQITLTGYVKTETRLVWLDIIKEERSSRSDEHPLLEAKVEAVDGILSTIMPPKCECPTPCFYTKVLDAYRLNDIRVHWSVDMKGRFAWARECRQAQDAARKGYWFDFDDIGSQEKDAEDP